MANDIFGGLMKGLSGFMPQDDPQVKRLNAQSELSELKQQEDAIFAEIGRQAYRADPGAYAQAEKLRLVQMNIAEAENKLAELTREKEQEQAEAARGTCPSCGHVNPEGTKFCLDCGSKLGGAKCVNCGASLPPGTRFCGACGARQGD